MEGMAANNDTRVAFDLAKAKAGAPVRTRDGRKVRILCFDRAGLRPIVALVKEDDDEESLLSYQEDGTLVTREPEYDLMMTGGKKTGRNYPFPA